MSDSADYVFELDAGRLCLDFVNTRGSTSGEHLSSYADLVAFARQSDLVTRADATWLQRQAQREPQPAAGVLTRALRLREALRGIFSALAEDRPVPPRDLADLNSNLAVSLPHARIEPASDGDHTRYAWTWNGREFDCVLWPIARSAAELLVSDAERPLIRECNASDCAWLFLDTSKNRTRQWCSMQSCGNREKARRHYQRVRARQGSAHTA